MNIHSLTLNDLHFDQFLSLYDVVEKNPEYTVVDYIYSFLAHPGVVRRFDTTYHQSKKKADYIKHLEKKVMSGKPIELFFNAYLPKSKKISITNGQIMPDLGELLSFIHLSMIAKTIRSVYSSGFRFVIAYEGNFFSNELSYTKEESNEVFRSLKELVLVAEKLTGVRKSIKLVDVCELTESYQAEFADLLLDKINETKEEYAKGDKNFISPLHVYQDFLIKNIYEKSDFRSDEDLKQQALEATIKARAFKKIKYIGGEKNLGILNNFPNAVHASVKMRTKTVMSINFFPTFSFYPYSRLIVLYNNGTLKQKTYKEIKDSDSFVPVYLDQYDYPFYYKEK